MSQVTSKGAWPLDEARPMADQVVKLLAPYCEKIQIAGSIRRGMAWVGDIEIVCIPIREAHSEPVYKEIQSVDLFGEPKTEKVLDTENPKLTYKPLKEFIQIVDSFQKIQGDADGRNARRLLESSIQLDLFMTTKADFYRIFAIRTGSAEFSKNVIAHSWVRRGWRGTPDGLRRADQCEEKYGKWICTAENPTLPPVWNSEEELFKFLGLTYTLPKYRF